MYWKLVFLMKKCSNAEKFANHGNNKNDNNDLFAFNNNIHYYIHVKNIYIL